MADYLIEKDIPAVSIFKEVSMTWEEWASCLVPFSLPSTATPPMLTQFILRPLSAGHVVRHYGQRVVLPPQPRGAAAMAPHAGKHLVCVNQGHAASFIEGMCS